MNTTPHLGENAELYALGVLDGAERAAVDAHVAECRSCLTLVGEAESTVATLAATLPAVRPSLLRQPRAQRPPAAAITRILAYAAALVLAIGFSAYAVFDARAQINPDRVALETLVHSHFLHASLAVDPSFAPLSAKVLYSRDGSWIYVVVDDAVPALRAIATVGGQTVDAGMLQSDGDIATLFAKLPGKAQSVTLRTADQKIGTVSLTYPR